MCQFNFFITTSNASPEDVGAIASEYGLNYFETILNISGTGDLKAFITTHKSCDCGSVLGKSAHAPKTQPDWDNERKKLERKRFSKRRIALLLEQKQKEFDNRTESEHKSEQDESGKWTDFLKDIRLKMHLPQIGILFHHFSGKLYEEKIKLKNEAVIPVNQVSLEFLKNLQEDELVWVKLK